MLKPINKGGCMMSNKKAESNSNSSTPVKTMEVIDNKVVSELKSVDDRFSNKGRNLNDIPPSPHHVENDHLRLGKQS
jgi:hypothetical protein